MKKLLVIFISFLFIISIGCSNSTSPNNENNHLTSEEVLTQANNEFAFSVFSHLIEDEVADNIMISPISLSIALSMTYNGADTDTAEQMASVLNYHHFDLDILNDMYLSLLQDLNNCDPLIQLFLANSIWIRNGFPVHSDFIDVNQTFYSADVFNRPFNDNTVDEINSWVEDNTNGNITDLISYLTPEDVMVLLNAIFFSGDWVFQFDPEETESEDFNLDDGTTKSVDMMKTSGHDFKYYFADDFSICRLPYGEDNVAMYVFLPYYTNTINDVIEELTLENWNIWKEEFEFLPEDEEYECFEFNLPKFQIDYEVRLKELLIELGMPIAFTSGADFSGISSELIWISRVKQKTYIEVNEEGTEAAAATSIIASNGEVPTFIANRPFLFLISDERTNTTLFIGKVGDPIYE